MKKFLLPLLVILFAATTAFTSAPEPRNQFDPVYHWFDARTGDYLGEFTEAEMRIACPANPPTECAKGYNAVQVINGQIVPSGTLQSTVYEL